jgi:hypothetical protein
VSAAARVVPNATPQSVLPKPNGTGGCQVRSAHVMNWPIDLTSLGNAASREMDRVVSFGMWHVQRWLSKARPTTKQRPRIGSVGYQRISHEALIAWLTSSQIKTVVDVRWTPFSFKKGWSKAPLRQILEEHGIEYRSLRALGTPTELRQKLRETGDFEHFQSEWCERVLPTVGVQAALDEVWQLACDGGVALLCLEHEPSQCHRSFLINALTARAEQTETLSYA